MQEGVTHISSADLSRQMGLTASQIRQDLNCFGGFGQQGYGYQVEPLYREIGRILGVQRRTEVILIGVGHVGHAIARQMDFTRLGMRLTALFDVSPALIGTQVGGLTIRPETELEAFCLEKKPKAALLCVPDRAAPDIVERLTVLGVTGFWNFTHYDIAHHHPGTVAENVHLEDSLMVLSYRLKQPRR